MADDDRVEGNPEASRRKKRRPPPVIELEAEEIGANEAPENREHAEDSTRSGTRRSETNTGNRMGGVSIPVVIAGAVGAVAGAVVIFLAVLLAQRTDEPRPRLAEEIASISTRLDVLARTPAPASPPNAGTGNVSALAERMDRLTAVIGETEQRLAAMERRPAPQAPDLSGIQQRATAIESTLTELRSAIGDLRRMAEQAPPAATPAAVEKLSSHIGTLEDRIASLAKAQQPAVAPSLPAEISALNALLTSIESGQPFARELAAARAAAAARAPGLAPIEPFAESGVATVPELAQRFSDLAPRLVRGPDPGGGFLSRLYTNATRLVDVRPVGEPPGTSVGAIVARMESRLGRGDLSGALEEADALPPEARSLAAEWLAAATQRRDAERTVKSAIAAALAAPGTSRP